jgi:hypothetical protein
MDKVELLKKQYRSQLEPFLTFLQIRREELSETDWHTAVSKTENHVLTSPDQYLSGLTEKNKAETDQIIRSLFRELLEEPDEPNS